MDKSYWLTQGQQTEITASVREIAKQIRDLPYDGPFSLSHIPEFVLAYKTGKTIKNSVPKNLTYVALKQLRKARAELHIQSPREDAWFNQFSEKELKAYRARSVDQILQEGRFGFCSEKAVLFRAFMIAQNVPVSYLECAIVDEEGKVESPHTAARVYAANETIIYDPENSQGFEDEIHYYNITGCVILREALDSWDIGIKSKKDVNGFLKSNTEIISKKGLELRLAVEKEYAANRTSPPFV